MNSTTDTDVRVAFAALVLAMLPAVLDQTVLATGLPTIARDLGSLSDVSAVVSAYVVAATASTPIWGKLGDRHGHKRLLQIALVVFLASSALCGLASDVTQLVAFRAVQGIGAGGLMTLAMAAVGDLVEPRERGRYQGYIAAAFAAATVIGPLAGGLLVDHAGWRWVFYLNLPLGLAALAALALRLPAGTPQRDRTPLDISGGALLALATCGLVLTCVWGGERYAWDSPTILALVAMTLAASALLVTREGRAADPIVPLKLLSTPVVSVASVALFLGTAALFSVTVFVPVFLQAATGASPTGAGLLLIPMMLGLAASTTVVGRLIERTGRYKRFPLLGLVLMSAALLFMGLVAGEESRVLMGAGLLVFGIGFGMVTQVLVLAVQNSVERARLGVATATTGFFRALGGAVGAAALGAVYSTRVDDGVTAAVQAVLLIAAPLALAALLVVTRLPELPLERRG
jgi:EmrB/QacA subfamily drug resistance transporter